MPDKGERKPYEVHWPPGKSGVGEVEVLWLSEADIPTFRRLGAQLVTHVPELPRVRTVVRREVAYPYYPAQYSREGMQGAFVGTAMANSPRGFVIALGSLFVGAVLVMIYVVTGFHNDSSGSTTTTSPTPVVCQPFCMPSGR